MFFAYPMKATPSIIIYTVIMLPSLATNYLYKEV